MHEPPTSTAGKSARNRRRRTIPMHPSVHGRVGMRFKSMAIWTLCIWQFVQVVFKKIMYARLIFRRMRSGRIKYTIDTIAIQQITNCPFHRANRQRGYFHYFPDAHVLGDTGCHEQHSLPSLSNAYLRHFDNIEIYRIPERFKVFVCCLQNSVLVVKNTRNILDDQCVRLQNLRTSHRSKVQKIPGIVSARMVIQIGMPLTRRPCDKNIYIPDLVAKSLFFRG